MKMKKNSPKVNELIKKKRLILEMKKRGIKRISPASFVLIDKKLKESLKDIIKILKEEMTINGRKTLQKQDVQKAFERINKKENYWEV